MGDAALVALGALLVAAAFLDALGTTLSVGKKQGWLTRLVTRALWRAIRWTARTRGVPSLLQPAGVLLLMASVALWVGLLWGGSTVLLLSDDAAVVDATTGRPASSAQVVYYAGFTVFTLGVGDYVAATDGWRVFTAAMSGAGLVLITLSITYLLSVVGAVVHRRSVAVHVRSLGRTPAEIVTTGWDGTQFGSPFEQHLVALTAEVSLLAEQHLAYPVLQYFHTGTADTSAPLAVAALDDALFLLEEGVAPQARLAGSATAPLRYAIERQLMTVTTTSERDGTEPPPLPDLQALTRAGIPVVTPAEFAARVRHAEPRRATTASFVHAAGWSWSDRDGA